MHSNSEYFRPFPAYEDVFYDDIENHKKHFLPICSVNLKCLIPERDEWCHFISVKEIHDGRVGDRTHEFHTQFTKEDMFGFDVIDGKYKFEADWEFFYINRLIKNRCMQSIIDEFEIKRSTFSSIQDVELWIGTLECNSELQTLLKDSVDSDASLNSDEIVFNKRKLRILSYLYGGIGFQDLNAVYEQNSNSFEAGKKYHKKYGNIYHKTLGWDDVTLEFLEEKELSDRNNYPDFEPTYPEIFGFLEDIKCKSKKIQNFIKREGIDVASNFVPFDYNMGDFPKNGKEVFEYIGCLKGYLFQRYGATNLKLFHDNNLKKAVICLDHD